MSTGVIYALFAYIAWGLLPLFWKLFDGLPAEAILAHRIIWSVVFVAGLLAAKKRLHEWKRLFASWAVFGAAALSALLISINWLVYIISVNSGHIVEASLGYYINPLISVLLGVFFLRERPSKLQWTALALAAAGVVVLTVSYGKFPWIALTLAFSFGLYGLAKKKTNVDPLLGLSWETIIPLPVAIGYLAYAGGFGAPFESAASLPLLLAGAATALPLLWFAEAAKRLPLSTVGLFQYAAPTISLILGIALYHEPFSSVHVVSFACIWGALLLYTASSFRIRAIQKQEAAQ
ncbi:EamA family transporter RarD [Paenibacillus thermotolerans]|uniref:EamA family transporter RarD n=1 Tax=Paenibacillus thermotolerans TaxID=3027807 RepID=UPI0023677E18|nr:MULTISPECIES: EamA family transporter RarD [unclassified Paenibacillus]